MNKEQLTQVVDFYEKVILAQIIKPQDINEIFLLVEPKGEVMQPYYKKMRAISIYVQGLKQQLVDGLDDLFEEVEEIPEADNPMSSQYDGSAATAPEPDNTGSHSEDNQTIPFINNSEIRTISPDDPALNYNDDDDTGESLTVDTDEVRQIVMHADGDKQTSEPIDSTVDDEGIDLVQEIAKLKAEYETASANVKRSISMKLKGLKRRQDESNNNAR